MNLRKRHDMYQLAKLAWPLAVQAGFGYDGVDFTAPAVGSGRRRAYVAEVSAWVYANTAHLEPEHHDARYRCMGSQGQYDLSLNLKFVAMGEVPIWA